MNAKRLSVTLLTLLFILRLTTMVAATPQQIKYQGRLSDANGDPLTGSYNLEFFLYDVPVGGSSLWSESHVGVAVVDGLFNVILGESSALTSGLFATDDLFFAIKINGGTETSPRQRLLSVPFARRVETVDGSGGGLISGILTVEEGLSVGTGNVLGDSTGIAFGANNSATGVYSSITGGTDNVASNRRAHIGGGYLNQATGYFTTIGGGYDNTAISSYTTVGGGVNNEVDGFASVVAGGVGNVVTGDNSMIGGGYGNTASGISSAIAGGSNNLSSNTYSSILGGIGNQCNGERSSILGGGNNTLSDSYSAIVGGSTNQNNGAYSTILGGSNCGIYDLLGAPSNYVLTFGQNVNQRGATRIINFFDGPSHGRLALNRDNDDGPISYPIHVGTGTSNGNGAHLTAGGVWTNASSREFKENFTPLNEQQLFDAIESLNIEGWSYRESDEYHIGPYAEEFVAAFGVGTIDEETGERVNNYLAAGDVAGVALAAVKELIAENRELKSALAANRAETIALKERVEKLEELLEMLAEN